ncbi:RNA-binding protein 33-like protein [Leptotrombidium deliense]|uniref:RNA-binding protein 33-like protein n=1 Tax=Leptotrombidium deliense TaxID=299467 RepID=A0A443SMG0_9ACAR|nr:RNA-binding protein 33-like protein [Leptotrombidium deliense]
MSFEIFSDSYELSIEENNDNSDDFEFEVNEDDVKEMLFDDNYDSSRLLKDTPTKCTGNDKKSNCEVVTPTKDESSESEVKLNSDRKHLNLITLTESEDTEKPVNFPEDDDDEDEEEERHARFRSERYKSDSSAANNRKISTRDIPDSLDKVVVSAAMNERPNGFNDQKRYTENRKLRNTKNLENISQSTPVWSNPPIPRPGNVASASTPYLTQNQPSQFPPSAFPNNFSFSGTVGQPHFIAPLCPNPQNTSPHMLHQRPIFQEPPVQNPRYLPQHMFAARFPQQYPPTRAELPNFPRPEPIPGLIPAPMPNVVERCQVPTILGTTTCRTLLPNPILNQPHQHPPPPQVPPTQLLPPRLPQFAPNADFGILQSREFLQQHSDKNQQYRNDVRVDKRNAPFSASTSNKFMKTSNNNKLLRAKYSGLKTVCNGTENDSRKVALNKTKMAKKFLQKRPGTSVKQIPCKPQNNEQKPQTVKSEVKLETNASNSDKALEKISLVDLQVDDDYKKAMEKQKQMREEVLKRKEERRRLNAMKKLHEVELKKTVQPQAQHKSSPPSAASNLLSEKNSPIKTLVNRTGVRCQNQSTQRERQVVQVNQTQNCISNTQKKTVKIKGLALSTNESSINKLCNSVGIVSSVRINQENGEKIATVVFNSSKDAAIFQQKYQRHLLDLCVIQVTLV